MEKKQYVSFCFLILHYIDIDLTHKTVESVMSLYDFNDSKIIIVDNASPNGSGKVLLEKYKNMEQIHIILSPENVGFSAGNNLGFQYIKQNFVVDFIVVINNDILFPQKEFIGKVRELYLDAPFWVAGPDIFQPHKNYHSSPTADKPRDERMVRREIEQCEITIEKFKKKFSLHVFKLYVKDCFSGNIFVQNLIKLRRFFCGQSKPYDRRSEGVVLQGACLIFDKRYCEKNDFLFFPLTFLYVEEDILTWRCMSNDWTIRYFPEIQVCHINHGSSQLSGLSYRKYCMKKIRELGIVQESYKIYLNQVILKN